MKIIFQISLACIMTLILVQCTPKVTEEIVEVKEEKEVTIPAAEAATSCVTFSKLSSRDRDIAMNAYVLYRDLAKLERYDEALPLWRTAFGLAPAADGQIRYQYEDGLKIYRHLYDQATDDQKSAYVDTIMAIYDKRVECFPADAEYVQGRKAFDYYYYYKSSISDDELFDLFKNTMDKQGAKVDYFIINPFTKMLYDKVVSGEMNNEEGRKYAHQIMDAISYGSDNCKKEECEAWKIIKSYAPDRLEALEGVDGFYDCEYYADKYFPIFQSNPDKCETIQSVYVRMVRGKCDINDPRLTEVKAKYNANCRKRNPSSGTLKEAYDLYTNGDYKGAVSKFDEFISKTTDVEKKTKYMMVVAKIYYRDIKNFPKARKYALDAAKLKSNWGEPYMLIGRLYASSGPLCGPGTGFDSQVVTWPAIDKFNYAKSIDPSVAPEANKLIGQYKKYMPSKADIFLRSIPENSTFTVKCWINEKTKVRVAD